MSPKKKTSPNDAQAIIKSEFDFLIGAHDQIIEEQEGRAARNRIRALRDLAKSLRTHPTREDERRLTSILRRLDTKNMLDLARAFTLLFWLLNLVEERHAARTRAAAGSDALVSVLKGLKRKGLDENEVAETLSDLRATLVLTAHPTEAMRWSLRQTIDRIDGLLNERLSAPKGRSGAALREENEREILAELTGLWLSTVTRSRKPTPLDEVRYAVHILQGVLVKAVPATTERLSRAFKAVYSREPKRGYAALEEAVDQTVHIGSWIGGDRDGNPFVTAEISAQARASYRTAILEHYRAQIQTLIERFTLSNQRVPVSAALAKSIEADLRDLTPLALAFEGHNPTERYRLKLNAIRLRLDASHRESSEGQPLTSQGGYAGVADFQADLQLVESSLLEHRGERLVEGPLRNLLRDIAIFGFDFVSLDVRQNQSKHRIARSELVCPSPGPLEALSLDNQQDFLESLILDQAPIEWRKQNLSSDAREVMETLDWVGHLPRPERGSTTQDLVISNTEDAIPVLELLALCRQVGLVRVEKKSARKKPAFETDVNIVPLFESIDGLKGATASMDRLYRSRAYKKQLAARGMNQQIMLGYSDSMKDGGYLAACSALEAVQGELAAQAREEGVRIEFFHGRGGSIARGGGPTNRAILAQQPGTVNGRIKITEQGEVIASKYGTLSEAEHNLGLILAATLEASVEGQQAASEKPISESWRDAFREMAEGSRAAYRSLVYETPGFVDSFYEMTPIEEISALNLGSRPAKRSNTRAIDNLRAIPWIFSWNQSRILLPSWYGVGTGFETYCAAAGKTPKDRAKAISRLQTMYRRWPYFRSVIDNLEQVLAKTDLRIAARYARLAREVEGSEEIFGRIEADFEATVRAVRLISKDRRLLTSDAPLREVLERRAPYLDTLSYLQVELLKRKKSRGTPPDEVATLQEAIHLTLNGIAAALRNTG